MSADDNLRQRLEFLQIDAADVEVLRELRPVFEKHADSFVSSFYSHLLRFEGTRVLLADPEVKKRLLRLQRDYLLSLTDAKFDAEYVAGRVRIGQTHERIRVEPRWYLGAYALYGNLLIPLISEHYSGNPAQAERAFGALAKVLMLDAQLAMEAYIVKREEELEFLTAELAEQSRDLERSYLKQRHTLRETAERARAAEQLAAVGTLVAGLAHEIGTPMGVIQGHAEMLESSVEDQRGRWRLQTIRDQIDRISQIIQTLLNMARPQPAQLTEVELRRVITTCLDFVQDRLSRRGIQASVELPFEATLEGDPQKLQQVFLNLFLNAADAMPQGGTLRVEMRPSESEPGVELEISDDGDGMSREVLDRIFEPFYSTKPAGGGSGLGLVVVNSIVDAHGGSIEVESQPGEGTRFRLRLPAQRSHS